MAFGCSFFCCSKPPILLCPLPQFHALNFVLAPPRRCFSIFPPKTDFYFCANPFKLGIGGYLRDRSFVFPALICRYLEIPVPPSNKILPLLPVNSVLVFFIRWDALVIDLPFCGRAPLVFLLPLCLAVFVDINSLEFPKLLGPACSDDHMVVLDCYLTYFIATMWFLLVHRWNPLIRFLTRSPCLRPLP